jgi:hypothetical protein
VFGGAWSEIFGFSQGTLRQLTLVFALITCAALFECARQLKMPLAACCLAATLPLASPIFIGLSYSFMTDVPGAAFVVVSLAFFLRSLNRASGGRVDYALGVFVLFLAVLLRQTSIAVALALVVAAPVARGVSFGPILRSAFVVGIMVFSYAAVTQLLDDRVGLPAAYGSKTDALLDFVADVLSGNLGAFRQSLRAILVVSAQYGLFISPLIPVLWSASRPECGRHVLHAAFAAALLTSGSVYFGITVPSMRTGNILSTEGLGPRLILGEMHPLPVTALVVTAVGHFLAAYSVSLLVDGLSRKRGLEVDPGVKAGVILLVATAVLIYAPHTLAYAAVFDRYALLPSILLAVVVLRAVSFNYTAAQFLLSSALLVGAGFLASLTLTADFFRWQDARYDLINRLVESGAVSANEIDGGFEYNNLQFILEHPEDAVSLRLVDPSERPVRLTREPSVGEDIVATQQYRRPLGLGTGEIYAVR